MRVKKLLVLCVSAVLAGSMLLAGCSKKEESKTEQILEGKTFVVTGSLDHFDNRKQLKEEIEQMGGKVTGSVSKKTDYLINNDKMSQSSKNKKAMELNIPILSEEDFLNLIGR